MAGMRIVKRSLICLAATSLVAASWPAFAQSGQRSGAGPCRQGALALIAMLDDRDDTSADYRHAYDGVVKSCGPKSRKTPAAAVDRGTCRDLALKLLDAIEEGRLNSPAFADIREVFAASCAPR